MSIIIKSLDSLPEHCFDCPCHNGESGYCQADKEHRYCIDRPPWCPLLEIPPVKAIPISAIKKMKSRISELNEFSKDEIDELYMQDIIKIIDECCGIIETESEDKDDIKVSKMTYGDIYNEFCKKFPNVEVEDYRPAVEMYVPLLSRGIPNAIIVWLKDGSKVIYIAGSAE